MADDRFRAILDGDRCVNPASVFDPLTARMAGDAGFELAVLGGSVAALVILGAPDHALLTLDELAGLCRRICRNAPIPLMVDADHGFGNALNAMRCVEELELAGVAGISLEDTVLPYPFGLTEPTLLSVEEATGKIAAAIAARRNPDFAILARTTVRQGEIDDLVERARAYAGAGASGIFLTRARRIAEVEAVRNATKLPLVLGAARGELASANLASLGVRVCLQGHHVLPAALSAAWKSYQTSRGSPLAEQGPPDDFMDRYSEAARYENLIDKFLK